MNESLTIMNTEHAKAYLDILFGRKTVDDIRQEFNFPPLPEPIVEEPTEFTTKNDAMFSIFPDDENPEDIRIEILPDFVWNKEDVWELVAELLEKVGSIDKEGNVLDEDDPDLNIDTANIGNLTAGKLTTFNGALSFDFENGRMTFEVEPFVFEDGKFHINTAETYKDIDFSALEEELGHMHDWFGENLSNIISKSNSLQERIQNLEKENTKPQKQILMIRSGPFISDEQAKAIKAQAEQTLKEANIDGVAFVLSGESVDVNFLKTW